MKQWVWLLSMVLALCACTGPSPKKSGPGNEIAYQHRLESIGSIDSWSLVGRVSLDDGDEGGSGKLQWLVSNDESRLDFHAAMGRGAWQLEIDPQGAVLKEANGDEQRAPRVDALIQQQIGWAVPVEALKWWIRGLAAPGPVEGKQLDEQGLLVNLTQFGWQIDFNRYGMDSGISMPTRLQAKRENYRIKLAISRWQINDNSNAK